MIHAPGRRQKILRNRRDDDDESLEPHSCVYEHADDENDDQIIAISFKPKNLRRNDVATHHRIVCPPIRSGMIRAEPREQMREWFWKSVPMAESSPLKRISAIIRDEQFHRVCVADD